MATNTELELYMIKHNIKNTIICKDKNLTDYPYKTGSYIINIKNRHWVLLVIKNNLAFYFDSMGEYPIQPVFQFINKNIFPNKAQLVFNTTQIQSSLTDGNCGWYSVALLKHFQKTKYSQNELFNFINVFSNDLSQNPTILKTLL